MNIKKLIITNLSFQDYLEKFKRYVVQIGYGLCSQDQFPRSLKEFLHWLESQGIEAIEDVDSKTIKRFYVYLQNRPNQRNYGGLLSQSHLVSIMYGLRVFYDYLINNQVVTHSPFDTLNFPQAQYLERESLTRPQIQALYDACENLRDKALLSIYYGCGLRLSEGANLQINDIHFNEGILYVTEGKGRRRRAVPMSGKVANDLMSYYRLERPQVAVNTFLINKKNKAITRETVGKYFKNLVEKADLPKHYGLHHLRHSIATHLLENGMKIEQVADFLGHLCLESTQIYAKVSTEYLLKNL